MSIQDSLFYEFGPYCLDVSARILVRDGQPVSLEPKVFDTLLVLVQNRGKVVKKDDLMKGVWPDTFVQEDSLTRNISVLRKTLAEGLNGAQCIETFSRRGYRFSEPVTERTEQDAKLLLLERTRAMLTVEEEEIIDGPPQQNLDAEAGLLPSARAQARLRLRLIVPVGCLVFAGLVVAVLYYRHRAERQTIVPQHISERPAVAVLGFKNLSGRPESEWISTALSEMLTTELAVGEKLRLVRAEETATGRTDVSLGVNERYSKESLNHLRQTLGIDYVVVGV